MMAEAWFVVETKFRREPQAEDDIRALGFECFMPIEVRRRQDRTRNKRPIIEYTVPMFPRYVFPRFDISQPCGWQRIARLHTVKGWLKPAATSLPSPVRQDFIDRVKAEQIAVRAALTNDHAITLEPLPAGTRVIIQEGPFATLGGIVSMSTSQRVRLLLDAVGFSDLHIARRSVAVAS
jgi:transcription antitermination factor NusG